MTEEQKLAIRCAYVDINHALKANELNELDTIDWDALGQTIIDLEDAFAFLTDEDSEL